MSKPRRRVAAPGPRRKLTPLELVTLERAARSPDPLTLGPLEAGDSGEPLFAWRGSLLVEGREAALDDLAAEALALAGLPAETLERLSRGAGRVYCLAASGWRTLERLRTVELTDEEAASIFGGEAADREALAPGPRRRKGQFDDDAKAGLNEGLSCRVDPAPRPRSLAAGAPVSDCGPDALRERLLALPLTAPAPGFRADWLVVGRSAARAWLAGELLALARGDREALDRLAAPADLPLRARRALALAAALVAANDPEAPAFSPGAAVAPPASRALAGVAADLGRAGALGGEAGRLVAALARGPVTGLAVRAAQALAALATEDEGPRQESPPVAFAPLGDASPGPLVGLEDAAKLFKVPRRYLAGDRWARRQGFPPSVSRGRSRLFALGALLAWARAAGEPFDEAFARALAERTVEDNREDS